ncbi:hypothetical protein WI89_12285 [Burkholderia ubonensis]|nr:hypothetical protein WI89_12285 [Burkholderia ubonensis]
MSIWSTALSNLSIGMDQVAGLPECLRVSPETFIEAFEFDSDLNQCGEVPTFNGKHLLLFVEWSRTRGLCTFHVPAEPIGKHHFKNRSVQRGRSQPGACLNTSSSLFPAIAEVVS